MTKNDIHKSHGAYQGHGLDLSILSIEVEYENESDNCQMVHNTYNKLVATSAFAQVFKTRV